MPLHSITNALNYLKKFIFSKEQPIEHIIKEMVDYADTAWRGAVLAVALTGTLYGCILQSLIAGPIAEKLALRSHEEAFAKEIILQGVLSIQAGNNPRVVEMQLLSFLSAKQQAAIPKAA